VIAIVVVLSLAAARALGGEQCTGWECTCYLLAEDLTDKLDAELGLAMSFFVDFV
jgi:hypothetical protein